MNDLLGVCSRKTDDAEQGSEGFGHARAYRSRLVHDVFRANEVLLCLEGKVKTVLHLCSVIRFG